MTLAELATRSVLVVGPSTSLEEALGLMEKHHLRHLPVVERGRLVGMLSDRDLLLAVGWKHEGDRRLSEESRELAGPAAVAEVMSAPVISLALDSTVRQAAEVLVDHKIDALPLVEKGLLVGIVTTGDLLRYFREPVRWWASSAALGDTVAEHMQTCLVTIRPRETLEEAAGLMRRHRIRHLPVVAGGDLIGLVSDRDLRRSCGRALIEDAQAEVDGRLYVEKTRVLDTMSRYIHTIAPQATLRDAANKMREHRIGALPVCDGERLVGILTGTDLLRAVGASDEAQPAEEALHLSAPGREEVT